MFFLYLIFVCFSSLLRKLGRKAVEFVFCSKVEERVLWNWINDFINLVVKKRDEG